MGAGILPITIHNNKLYFLFGKENMFADTPGWSDFGGGTETGESFLTTASREGGEELTGFLGSSSEIENLLKKGTYNIDIGKGKKIYRMFLLPMQYSEELPHYYNNNQKFLQTHLDKNIIKNSKIFEKAEIKWMPADTLLKNKNLFRSYFQNVISTLIEQQKQITDFVQKSLKNDKKKLYIPIIYQMGSSMSSSRKGTRSKTHPGRKNYTTKKGDKVFHRKGRYVRLSRKPYIKTGKRTFRRY